MVRVVCAAAWLRDGSELPGCEAQEPTRKPRNQRPAAAPADATVQDEPSGHASAVPRARPDLSEPGCGAGDLFSGRGSKALRAFSRASL
jgi:hypothetical protein